MAATIKKKEGFEGQKAISIPRKILNRQCVSNPVLNTLYITDIGYYPKAKYHYRERLHGADQHIFIYCQEGSGWFKVDKTRYEVGAGDFFFIPAKIPHKYGSDEKNPWTIYWTHFKGDISHGIISLFEEQAPRKTGHVMYNEISLNLFNEIYAQLERGYGSDTLGFVNIGFWHFLSSFIYNTKYESPVRLSEKTKIETAIDLLKSSIGETLSLSDMAGSVNLSVTHFCFLFKNKTGYPPIEYFNHLKVQKACQYLLFTDYRIKEISKKLGIDDQFYFTRMFTKVMGMSPNKYREKALH